MHILDLPFDILSLILEMMSRKDTLQLVQTCRRAYDIAMPRILSSIVLGENRPPGLRFGPIPPLPMRGSQQLSMLTTFLLSDVEKWPTCIHSLTMHPNAFGCPPQPGRLFSQRDYSGGHLFAETLRNARNLHSVDIGDVEVLLQQCPSFESVLCGFGQLDRVKFSGLGPLFAAMLTRMRSRLRRIELHGVGTHIQTILHALRPHAATAEMLALEGCFSPPTGLEISVFPHVHTLVLGGYAPPLSTMSMAFPNVRIGRFHNFRPSGKATTAVEWVEWPSLDTIEISALLPLTSPVRYIRLGPGLILNPHTPPETVASLLNILGRTQPVVLSFMISGIPPGFFDGLTTEVRSVRYLEMTRINTFRDGVGLFLAEALNGISTLPLVAVSLGRIRGLEPSLNEMDDQAATSIANMLPTVRFIGSFTDSDVLPDCRSRRWFRVTSRPSETVRRVEEVPRQEVESITSFLEALDRGAE
ncbi:hypothetical protein L226DRAFT_531102 [Lentinus tigrinus ALCF2SS1-7]|uniref:F-box domain-containing protein n=1 Tax=Lentinus tigrinus ALCF2SS1-6 TaxID=1328759 RepID=A0A5C2SVN9_9APHY|nr:hypothetical protein L227DRAFT_570641 [Lentinus tigrinus ALCF2SS1-6]RPD79285.1 hypothetical protein L226DRAFT_531102 [Lentinus tigrinus ALCF2SS1-7]